MTHLSNRRSKLREEQTLYFLEILDAHYESCVTPFGKTTDWITILNECHREGVLRNVTHPRYLSRTKWPSLMRSAKIEFNSNKPLSAIAEKVISIVQQSNPSFCQSREENEEIVFIDPPMDFSDDEGVEFVDFPDYDGDYFEEDSFDDEQAVSDLLDELITRVDAENSAVISDLEMKPSVVVAEPVEASTIEVMAEHSAHADAVCHCPAHLEALRAVTEFNKAQTELVRLKAEKLRKQMSTSYE